MTVPAVRSTVLLELDVFAERCGLHPDLICRFIALGLIDPAEGTGRDLWFAPTQMTRVDRMLRLRSDLSLNYAALGLVLDLLDRIEQLERAPGRGATSALEH